MVKGQVATKLSHKNRTRQQQFDVFHDLYMANGRPLRNIKFQNQVVDWEDKGDGIYKSFLARELSPGLTAPPAAPSG